eukprot:5505013-Pyramimonas_sp.AAC.1
MARTLRLAQVHASDGTGTPPSEDEWNQVLSVIAWAAAMPQLDKTVRDLYQELGLATRIPDAFNAYWNTHPPPGTRNPAGRRIHSRQAALTADAACAQLRQLAG